MKKPKRDPFDTPDFKRYARRVREEMLPKMMDSAYVISIAPDGSEVDVKIAVEIGYAILLDKPLIVMAPEGRHVAEKLLRIADHVITGDMDSPLGMAEMQAKLQWALKQ